MAVTNDVRYDMICPCPIYLVIGTHLHTLCSNTCDPLPSRAPVNPFTETESTPPRLFPSNSVSTPMGPEQGSQIALLLWPSLFIRSRLEIPYGCPLARSLAHMPVYLYQG